jgi:hypothetical protein
MAVFRKKGESNTINLVVGAVIILITAVIIFYMLKWVPVWFGRAADCVTNGGDCQDATSGCPEKYYVDNAFTCKEEGKKCCRPETAKVDELTRFTTEQRKALIDPIILTLGDNPKPITELILKDSYNVTAHVKINDKLPSNAFGPVIIYLTDSFKPESLGALTVIRPLDPNNLIIQVANNQDWLLSETGENLITRSKNIVTSIDLPLQPRLKESYHKIMLNIIILDQLKLACRSTLSEDPTGKLWETCLKNTQGQTDTVLYSSDLNDKNNPIKQVLSDKSYYLASKSYPITVQRILDISGVGTSWAAEDTITLTTSDLAYSNAPGILLINAASLGADAVGMDKIIAECTDPKNDANFKTSLNNIVGTTLETSGIDLGINFGGFRVPTSKTELKYLVTPKKIMMAKGKTDIKIDKASLLKDLFASTAGTITDEGAKMAASQSLFVCAKVSDSKGNKAYAVSSTPLMVDILPPAIRQDDKGQALDVQITYPDPITNNPQYSNQYPSIAGQNYFYKAYPRITIPCYDDQSGCVSYDYYLKTGNFVNVNVQSDNVGDAITGVALQFGLNQLLEYFAKKDVYNTICPYIFSNEFRLNTKPVITLNTKGQGIVCIRIKDKAGNAVMVWKEIWTPDEMMKRVAIEEANNALTSTIASAMT